MKINKIGTIELTDKNKDWFNRKGYEMTGETVEIEWEDGTAAEIVVFKGTWTRSSTVRDCGDHYIYAGYADYYKIDKNTLEISRTDIDR